MQLGARGVVMKDAPGVTLVKAIRGVLAGEVWIGRERVESLRGGHAAAAPNVRVTTGPDHGLTPGSC